MAKKKRNKYNNVIIVAVLIVCAVIARVLGMNTTYPVQFGLIRTMIYIGLYIGWGISVSKRVIQAQVRRYLVSVSGLMVFWFIIRSMKYYFISDVGTARQLWYLYYLPMLFIPLFSLFAAISLGESKNFKLSKKTLMLYIPTVLCLLLVLTNDFHQLVFSFPADEVWTDKSYEYALGCYIVVGWEIICAMAAFIQMSACAKGGISAVPAADMLCNICLNLFKRRGMDAAYRRRHHCSAVSDVRRNIGKLYSLRTDPDQYRL